RLTASSIVMDLSGIVAPIPSIHVVDPQKAKPSTWLVPRLTWRGRPAERSLPEHGQGGRMADTGGQFYSVVTGGASGIGTAVAVALRERVHMVTVLDVRTGTAPGIYYESTDLTDEAAVSEAFDRATERSGRITNLVACAGIRGEFQPALDLEVEQMRRVLEVNILGTFIPARGMVRRLHGKQGSVVALSSTTSYGGWKNQADYGTSKAAVRSLVEHLAIVWAQIGVRVNAVAPGHTLTPMVQSMVGEGYDL